MKYLRKQFLRASKAALLLITIACMAVPAAASAAITAQSWTIHTGPTTLPATDIAMQTIVWAPGLSLFVAIANDATGNTVVTSPDGITWTRRTPAANDGWSSVAWSPALGKLAAVASSGSGSRVMYSSDGITWTAGSGAPTEQWASVAWSPSLAKFVAVSNAVTNAVMYSTDGITWSTSGVSGAGTDLWQSIAWSPDLSLFVAVSNTAGTGNEVMTSPDGLTWTMRTAASSSNWITVTWATSATAATAAVTAGATGCTGGSTGIFVALAGSPATEMYSCNGTNWTTSSTGGTGSEAWKGVTFGGSTFVAVGTTGVAMSSTDGLTWTSRTANVPATNNLKAITYNPTGTDPNSGLTGFFTAVATSGINRAITSHDGITWTAQQTAVYSWLSVAWSPTANTTGTLVAVTNSGTLLNRVMYSTDGGSTWSYANAATNNNWKAVTWSADLGIFVAVAASGTGNRVMTSSDGIHWTSQTSAGDLSWNSIVWASSTSLAQANATAGTPGCTNASLGMFVATVSAVSGTTRVMKSCNGTTWSLSTTPNANFFSVAWGATAGGTGQFVAVGNTAGAANEVIYSADGITWSTATAASSSSWASVAWSPELSEFVAVSTVGGTTSDIMVSPSGTAAGTWTLATAPSTTVINSVAWSPALGIFTIVGNAGAVYVSSTGTGTWLSRTAAANNNWSSVVWAPELGKFVAVSNGLSTTGDQIMTSQAPVAPTISSVSSGTPGVNSATITWTTDEQSSSQVNYGTTASYGSSTTLDSTQVTSHSVLISGLACGTTYHYQASSTYLSLNTLSSDNTFTTGSCSVPTVTAQAASSITASGATLNGTITATGGANATVRGFNYGLTASYGSTTTASGSFGTGAFTASVSGLTCNTVYHYQTYATNTAGTGTSSDATFTTGSCSAPTVTAQAASSITATGATLNGTITATGGVNATARGFNYGLTTGYELTPTTESGSFSTGAFTASLSSLTCNTVYHYQTYATNISGTGTSTPDATFTTSSCPVVASSSSGSSTAHYITVVPSSSSTSSGGAAPLDFTINGGAQTTASPALTIRFNANPATVTGYAISLDQSLPEGIRTYVPTTTFTLPAKAGKYTLYVKFFSTTGNPSALLSHTITYQAGSGTSASVAKFSRTLSLGARGQDVALLQAFLNAHGFVIAQSGPGSPGNETTFYGKGTMAAVRAFQEAHMAEILTPLGYTKGTGTFGPSTIRIVLSLISKG